MSSGPGLLSEGGDVELDSRPRDDRPGGGVELGVDVELSIGNFELGEAAAAAARAANCCCMMSSGLTNGSAGLKPTNGGGGGGGGGGGAANGA